MNPTKSTIAVAAAILSATIAHGQPAAEQKPDDDARKAAPAPDVAPQPVDEELAAIDPRLAKGIAANEKAFGKKLDRESYDNQKDGVKNARPAAQRSAAAAPAEEAGAQRESSSGKPASRKSPSVEPSGAE